MKFLQRTTSGAAGSDLGTTIKYLRAAAGNDLGITIKCLRGAAGIGLGTTIKYLRRSTRGAAVNGLGTTLNYLRGAAGVDLGTTMKYLRRTTSAASNSSLGTTIKYIVNQNAGAGNNWAKAHVHNSWARVQMSFPCSVAVFVVNSEPPHRSTSLGPFVRGAQAFSLCSCSGSVRYKPLSARGRRLAPGAEKKRSSPVAWAKRGSIIHFRAGVG